MIEKCSFVALTTEGLEAAKAFWVNLLGFPVTGERANEYFIVDAGGLRLCVDKEDGDVHRLGGADPTVSLKVGSAAAAVSERVNRGLKEEPKVVAAARGAYAIVHDPDGRSVILSGHD